MRFKKMLAVGLSIAMAITPVTPAFAEEVVVEDEVVEVEADGGYVNTADVKINVTAVLDSSGANDGDKANMKGVAGIIIDDVKYVPYAISSNWAVLENFDSASYNGYVFAKDGSLSEDEKIDDKEVAKNLLSQNAISFGTHNIEFVAANEYVICDTKVLFNGDNKYDATTKTFNADGSAYNDATDGIQFRVMPGVINENSKAKNNMVFADKKLTIYTDTLSQGSISADIIKLDKPSDGTPVPAITKTYKIYNAAQYAKAKEDKKYKESGNFNPIFTQTDAGAPAPGVRFADLFNSNIGNYTYVEEVSLLDTTPVGTYVYDLTVVNPNYNVTLKYIEDKEDAVTKLHSAEVISETTVELPYMTAKAYDANSKEKKVGELLKDAIMKNLPDGRDVQNTYMDIKEKQLKDYPGKFDVAFNSASTNMLLSVNEADLAYAYQTITPKTEAKDGKRNTTIYVNTTKKDDNAGLVPVGVYLADQNEASGYKLAGKVYVSPISANGTKQVGADTFEYGAIPTDNADLEKFVKDNYPDYRIDGFYTTLGDLKSLVGYYTVRDFNEYTKEYYDRNFTKPLYYGFNPKGVSTYTSGEDTSFLWRNVTQSVVQGKDVFANKPENVMLLIVPKDAAFINVTVKNANGADVATVNSTVIKGTEATKASVAALVTTKYPNAQVSKVILNGKEVADADKLSITGTYYFTVVASGINDEDKPVEPTPTPAPTTPLAMTVAGKNITVAPGSGAITVYKGAKIQLAAGASADNKNASVNKKGVASAKKVGTVNLTNGQDKIAVTIVDVKSAVKKLYAVDGKATLKLAGLEEYTTVNVKKGAAVEKNADGSFTLAPGKYDVYVLGKKFACTVK